MLRVFAVIASYAAFAAMMTAGTPVSITLGQDVDWPPYAYKVGTQLAGIGYDIAMGLNAQCPNDLSITVQQVNWNDCWTSQDTLGAKIADHTIDGCMTYTYTRGIRDQVAEFSWSFLKDIKSAGLVTMLNADGTPKVTGSDNLAGKTVVDVGGWAPTSDTIAMVKNQCTNSFYSTGVTVVVGNGNEESMMMLRNNTAHAMYIYADQVQQRVSTCATASAYDCTQWNGFGTQYAYVQTGQFNWTLNGTTLILGKKGRGKAALVNNCLKQYMLTQAYYQVCAKHNMTSSCYPNQYFPSSSSTQAMYSLPTNQLTTCDCSTGYCPCTFSTCTTTNTGQPVQTNGQGSSSMHVVAIAALALAQLW